MIDKMQINLILFTWTGPFQEKKDLWPSFKRQEHPFDSWTYHKYFSLGCISSHHTVSAGHCKSFISVFLMHWSSGIGSSVTKADGCWSPQLPKWASCVLYHCLIGILIEFSCVLFLVALKISIRQGRDSHMMSTSCVCTARSLFCVGYRGIVLYIIQQVHLVSTHVCLLFGKSSNKPALPSHTAPLPCDFDNGDLCFIL